LQVDRIDPMCLHQMVCVAVHVAVVADVGVDVVVAPHVDVDVGVAMREVAIK
jgi:hypothetical protein